MPRAEGADLERSEGGVGRSGPSSCYWSWPDCSSSSRTGQRATGSRPAARPRRRALETASPDIPPSSAAVSVDSNSASPTDPTSTTTTIDFRPGCIPAESVAAWPLRRRLAQLLMVGGQSKQAAEDAVDAGVGGIFLHGDGTAVFQDRYLESLKDAAAAGLVVSVDDEGGRVQRIEGVAGPMPSAREMAATMSVPEVRALAEERGQVSRDLGVTMDLAPVVDVSAQGEDEVIGDRSFSDDPEVVAAYARAVAEGLIAAGISPVFKHFPGHGRAQGDSHRGPSVAPRLAQLERSDLLPYRDLLGEVPVDAGVMIGHLDVPGLTGPGQPATVSPAAVNGLLRRDIGFDGLVVTDDLSGMRAITGRFGVGEASVRALVTGADLLLYMEADVPAVVDVLEAAVAEGRLSEDAVNTSALRVLAAKDFDPCSS